MAGQILIVDDEEILRKLMLSVLKMGGFEVTEVESAEAALELADSGSFNFDLVATDLQLLNMNGIQLAGEIRKRFPEVGILLITGYGAQLQDDVAFSMLAKPFRPNELLSAVNAELARRPRKDGGFPEVK